MQDSDLNRIDENRWEIPCSGDMRVPGRIFANSRLAALLAKDRSINQVKNVATLPGIVGYSIAMPDIHEGYGFPIGGVAAMDYNSGIISPGGVGYDINCGVRLIRTNLVYREIKDRLKVIIDRLYNSIPTGVGSRGAIRKLSSKELDQIMIRGARWAIENGYGDETSLIYMEEQGMMPGANPDAVSTKARSRGLDQMGTLGSGNHFIELGKIDEIFDSSAADFLGLRKDQVIVLIHSGSRGFGHQICDDYVAEMKRKKNEIDFHLPDIQLISSYINSPLGKKYYSAMVSAANYAWSNRQVMMSLVEKELSRILDIPTRELGYRLIYDVSHNIAKLEEHFFDGRKRLLCVHRKGATRAFGPGHPLIPERYRDIGQPVIIPGDMGRYSYLCLGTEQGMRETFGSSCHGAGRIMSRKEALRSSTAIRVLDEMQKRDILVHSATRSTLVEEMSNAYKDVSDVVDTMTDCGLLKKVIKTKPIAVIKG